MNFDALYRELKGLTAVNVLLKASCGLASLCPSYNVSHYRYTLSSVRLYTTQHTHSIIPLQ